MADVEMDVENAPINEPKPKKAGKPTVEQTYTKLTQHEHILQRPDTYVGAIEALTNDSARLSRSARARAPRAAGGAPRPRVPRPARPAPRARGSPAPARAVRQCG